MYISKYTDFVAYNKPLTKRIFYKDANILVCIIDILDDNWTMLGSLIDVQRNPFGIMGSLTLDQVHCEKLLMRRMPPPNRKDILIELGLEKWDAAEILYRTRGISLLDLTWFAWSIDDKVEDYHPLCNPELMAIREKDMIHFVDDEPLPPPMNGIDIDNIDYSIKFDD